MAAKVVKIIKKTGWPVFTRSGAVSKTWERAHKASNKATLKRFGSKVAKSINRIKVPSNELLGSHTRKGRLLVSSRVPEHLRGAIAYHEAVEHRLMMQKKRGRR